MFDISTTGAFKRAIEELYPQAFGYHLHPITGEEIQAVRMTLLLTLLRNQGHKAPNKTIVQRKLASLGYVNEGDLRASRPGFQKAHVFYK